MTLRSRTFIVVAVTAAAILTVAIWWRFPQSAPNAVLTPPSAPSSTSVPTSTTQVPRSGRPTVTDPNSPRPSPSSRQATPSSSDSSDQAEVNPTRGTTPSAQTLQAREQWRPVILGFARAYTSHQDDPAGWRANLGRYSAPAVIHALARSNPGQAATHSRYVSYDVLEYHDDEVAAQVSYGDGTALVLYVAQEEGGQSWVVRAFDRLAQ